MHAKTAAELAGRYGIDWRPNIDRILAISDALQKKGVTGKLDPTQLNIQNVRQDTVAVDSRPTNPEPERFRLLGSAHPSR